VVSCCAAGAAAGAGSAEVDAVAAELGLKRRRVRELLHLVQTRGPDVAAFLPARHRPRAKRVPPLS